MFYGGVLPPEIQQKARVHRTEPIFSVRIDIQYRVLGVRDEDRIIWFWIGSHADYDKLLSGRALR